MTVMITEEEMERPCDNKRKDGKEKVKTRN
jgi:hypothetical protein